MDLLFLLVELYEVDPYDQDVFQRILPDSGREHHLQDEYQNYELYQGLLHILSVLMT
jgi:hypothetical protein